MARPWKVNALPGTTPVGAAATVGRPGPRFGLKDLSAALRFRCGGLSIQRIIQLPFSGTKPRMLTSHRSGRNTTYPSIDQTNSVAASPAVACPCWRTERWHRVETVGRKAAQRLFSASRHPSTPGDPGYSSAYAGVPTIPRNNPGYHQRLRRFHGCSGPFVTAFCARAGPDRRAPPARAKVDSLSRCWGPAFRRRWSGQLFGD